MVSEDALAAARARDARWWELATQLERDQGTEREAAIVAEMREIGEANDAFREALAAEIQQDQELRMLVIAGEYERAAEILDTLPKDHPAVIQLRDQVDAWLRDHRPAPDAGA